MIIKNQKLYEVVKWLVCILPAINTLWLAIASIYNIECGKTVSLTILAVNTFICTVFKIDNYNYNKRLEETEG